MTTASAVPLQADGLGVSLARRSILADITLRVNPGCFVGLIGRNGAGKTTLLQCLLGLRTPDQGSARLFGKNPTALDDRDKARLGYVAQQPAGFDTLTVRAMLDFVASLYPTWDETRVARLLERCALDPSRRLAKLSPGERQQAAIIRALGTRPDLLVLDEPASALDPLARRHMLQEVAALAAESGTTVVFSTHILSDLERMASHIAVLHEGRLQVQAEMDDMKEHWRRLVWPAGTQLPSAPLPGEYRRQPLDTGGWSVLVRLDGDGAALRALPPGVVVHPLGLEDAFVELTA